MVHGVTHVVELGARQEEKIRQCVVWDDEMTCECVRVLLHSSW